jgi:hypothetical protein
LGRTSGLGVNEPTSFFATNIVCTLGHVYTYRDRVPISYSKCVVSLRKDYAQEENIRITGNTFTNLGVAIHLTKRENSGAQPTSLNFTLKCNKFVNDPQAPTSTYIRKGLVIEEGVLLKYTEDNLAVSNNIGGNGSFTSDKQYPNANVWPVGPGIQRNTRININGEDQDLHNPNLGYGWPNSLNWVAIDNQSGGSVTYWRYENEFVGWGSAIQGTVSTSIPPSGQRFRTFAQTQLPATDPNYIDPLEPGYDEACGTTFDTQPILFPARIAVVDNSNTVTSISSKDLPELMLGDAVPNPATNESKIGLLLPGSAHQAVLQFVDLASGRVLQNIPVTERGKLEVILDVSKASSGIYGYRLLVDGKPIGIRKLAVVK